MRLIEKDAKMVLRDLDIAVPHGVFLDWGTEDWPSDRDWTGPYYLKAQVLEGRRGQQGLIQYCVSKDAFKQALQDLHTRLSPDRCAGFWCEEAYPHTQEWLLSCDLDPVDGIIRAHVSQEGGKHVSRITTYRMEDLAQAREETHLPEPLRLLLQKLMQAFARLDAISIEMNPCVLGPDGQAVALDAKIELDEAASFRHPEWSTFAPLSRLGQGQSSREQAYSDLLLRTNRPLLGRYVELSGNIGVILAGGGASLVAMDALTRAGGAPANYLELSGNPDPLFLKEAAKIVCSHPNLRALWVAGSYANFTDIAATVGAILEAVEEVGLRVPIVIRRDGPRADEAEREALAWADRTGLTLLFQRADIDLFVSAQTLVGLLSK